MKPKIPQPRLVPVIYEHDKNLTGSIQPDLVKHVELEIPVEAERGRDLPLSFTEWDFLSTLPDGRQCIKVYKFHFSKLIRRDGSFLQPHEYPWTAENVDRILVE